MKTTVPKLIFSIIPKTEITTITPLLYALNSGNIPHEVLEERVKEMVNENYQCVGIFMNKELIGCCGLWFMTRHYSGKSCELDHVIIAENFRNMNIGKKLLDWIFEYLKEKKFEAIELNTYILNFKSHTFYEAAGFEKLGYHYVKRF